MKRIFVIIGMLAAVLSLNSCKESFIERDKPLSMTQSLVFEDAGYIESNLLGCYNVFKSTYPSFMDGTAFVVFDNRGDDIVNVKNPTTQQNTYEMAVLGSGSQENGYIWNYAYYTINYCNVFIDNLANYNCSEILGQKTYDQYVAEAKFLRAYSYYVLCNLYSQPYCLNPNAEAVPLRLTGLVSSGNNDCPLSTISQVYDQILADCLPDALPDEPNTYDGVTRASKAAAYLLKMRVYMAEQKWDEAIAAGKAITGYSLDSDVANLYGKDTYKSPEMIFALPNSLQDKPNTQMSCAEYFSADAAVASIDTEGGIASIEGYFLPEDARVSELTEESNGSIYSTKYVDYGGHLDWVPLMRYAEVKLNLAECYANKSDGTANAKTELSDVRRRSVSAENDVIDITSLSGGNLKTAVYNERRIEFLCEGMRGIDIIRRGENFVKKNSYVDLNVSPSDNNYTWPIPDTEKSYNKAI